MARLLGFFVLSLFLWSTPAAAHLSLSQSLPEDGAELSQAPAAIELTFSRPARLTSLTLSALSEDSREIALPISVEEAAQSFQAELPAMMPGGYVVGWTAVSSDMHTASGTIHFAVLPNATPVNEAATTGEPKTPASKTAPSRGFSVNSVDVTFAFLRFLGFAAILQAVGALIFLQIFREVRPTARMWVRKLALLSSALAIAVTAAGFFLEAGRMSGSWLGLFNADLLGLVLNSNSGAAHTVRMFGLGLITWGMSGPSEKGLTRSLIGGTVALLSFGMIGHVSSSPDKWLLYPLQIAHLTIAAFWFGALLPLLHILDKEEPSDAAIIFDAFSAIALWLVPTLFLVGLGLAYVLVGDLPTLLGTTYGWLILTKASLFGLLMGAAGLNKLRFGPALARGEQSGAAAMRLSVRIEYTLIVLVLLATAAMTSFFSPTA